MFTTADRASLRDGLVSAAEADDRIRAAAFVGSLAAGREDRWSDIDLALRLAPSLNPAEVIESWTHALYEQYDAVTHVDLWSGPTLFRVFLLRSSLQVDLSLWPDAEFAQHGGPFQLIFGKANNAKPPSPPRSRQAFIGMAWLHALHVRSSIARGRELQALYMLNGMRDQIISLACLHNDLFPDQGRGAPAASCAQSAAISDHRPLHRHQ